MMKKEEEIEKRGPIDPNALIKIDEESACRTAVLDFLYRKQRNPALREAA